MKALRDIVMPVFPPARLPVTWWSAWPLLAFFWAFLGTCLILDMLDLVMFSRLSPFALLALAPWFWWMHVAGYSGLTRGRATVALLVRLVLLGLFIALLTEPRAVRKDERLTVLYAVDRSHSITGTAEDLAKKYIVDTATQKPEKDHAGLVFFGRNAAVELPPGMSLPFEAVNVNVDRDGTDIAKALSLSAAMLPPEMQGRILLMSDGVENSGELSAVLNDLKGKGIAVDVLPIDYQYDSEVWLERLELPRFVKLGETYEAAAILNTLKAGEGRLVLQENGKTIFEDNVKFEAGKNRFTVPIRLRDPGYYEYKAEVELPQDKDSWKRNNVAISYLYIKGQGKVLVVTDPEGDNRVWGDMVRAMREAQRDVELMSAFELPRDPMALLTYDCIVFANVPRDAMDDVQLQAVHDAVYNQGSGFLMVGGENSYGPGGYQHTVIEKALPVTMDISQKKKMPKGALAIILHTCEFPDGNTWGKRITKQAIKVLSAQDEVGALGYDYQGGENWIFPLTPASEFERLSQLINAAQIGDMPSFATTMQMGLTGLKNSDAATKHMIIISDGDPQPAPPPLVQEFIDNKISVSTVAIFPHGGMVSSLQSVAELTGGRFYFPQDPNTLPSIFIKEAKTLRRTAIQNKVFTPRMQTYSPVIKGIDAIPDLGGYVLTTPKADSRVNVVLKGPEEDEIDPVLAVWRYGVGATAAFTSDLSTNWGKDWTQWDKYQAFIKQLLTEISRTGQESNLRVNTFPSEGNGVIFVEDYSPTESLMEVKARVQGPKGESQTVPLKQVGPRRYEGKFPLEGTGRYQVMAVGAGEGTEQRAHGGFVVPYSQEFLRFRSNPIVLEEIARKTGGRILKGSETGKEVFSPERVPKLSTRPIVDWLLIVLACLIPLDVGFRRVQLDWDVIKGWFVRRSAKTDQTMTALLTRKKQVATVLANKEQPMQTVPRPITSFKPAGYKPKTPSPTATPQPEPQEHEAATTTTSRLLAAKRRAGQQMKPDETSERK